MQVQIIQLVILYVVLNNNARTANEGEGGRDDDDDEEEEETETNGSQLQLFQIAMESSHGKSLRR